MRYCVLKGTASEINGSMSTDEDMLYSAASLGFSAEDIEIITQEEYDARKALEPQPVPQISDAERITELEQIINMLLMGEM